MAHSERCPVCEGSGKGVLAWTEGSAAMGEVGNSVLRHYPCHGCGGKGWVTVEDKSDGFNMWTTEDEERKICRNCGREVKREHICNPRESKNRIT